MTHAHSHTGGKPMPRETEADRIMRERSEQRVAQIRSQEAEEKRQAKEKRMHELQEMEKDIAHILPLLGRLNYPFMESHFILIKRTRFFGLLHSSDTYVEKAGWVVAELGSGSLEYQGGTRVCLLSDGSLSIGSIVLDRVAMYPEYHEPKFNEPGYDLLKHETRTTFLLRFPEIIAGIHKLREKLEWLEAM